jgi:hypothetical protein
MLPIATARDVAIQPVKIYAMRNSADVEGEDRELLPMRRYLFSNEPD